MQANTVATELDFISSDYTETAAMICNKLNTFINAYTRDNKDEIIEFFENGESSQYTLSSRSLASSKDTVIFNIRNEEYTIALGSPKDIYEAAFGEGICESVAFNFIMEKAVTKDIFIPIRTEYEVIGVISTIRNGFDIDKFKVNSLNGKELQEAHISFIRYQELLANSTQLNINVLQNKAKEEYEKASKQSEYLNKKAALTWQ